MVVKYQSRIKEIQIEEIEVNAYNPRERFNEEEEEELIESILEKGILNPIIVYFDTLKSKYIILDGERRYRACKKINISTIPARILLNEPSVLESLSLMFHVHNVREDWTEFAISVTIKRIITEMGKNLQELDSDIIKELSKITSLSTYKVRKYLKFQDYPQDVIDRFLISEITGKKDSGPDPDILLEMHRPIQEIKEQMPQLLDEYSIYSIINACIEKKDLGIIKNNKEFRLISQSLSAAKKGEIDSLILRENLERLFSNVAYTPSMLFHETAETLYRYKSTIKASESFLEVLKRADFGSLDQEQKDEVRLKFNELLQIIASINENI